jgi:transposase
MLADQLRETQEKIDDLTARIEAAQKADSLARRLATIPGIGAVTASAIAATTPEVDNFRSARDYAAWLGLTPQPHSSGSKERLGRISKAGNRYLRRLLYLGAMAQISARRCRRPGDDWLWRMLQKKPVKVVAVALANRMAEWRYCNLKSGNSLEFGALTPCRGGPRQGLSILVFHGVVNQPWRRANGQTKGYGG